MEPAPSILLPTVGWSLLHPFHTCAHKSHLLLDDLDRRLTGHVLDHQLCRVHILPAALDLRLALRQVIGGILLRQGAQRVTLFGIFRQQAHSAEDDHTAEMRGEGCLLHLIRVDHAKGNLLIARDAVELMPRLREMEVQPARFIGVTERHSVGVARVAVHRQHPRGAGTQNLDRFSFG